MAFLSRECVRGAVILLSFPCQKMFYPVEGLKSRFPGGTSLAAHFSVQSWSLLVVPCPAIPRHPSAGSPASPHTLVLCKVQLPHSFTCLVCNCLQFSSFNQCLQQVSELSPNSKFLFVYPNMGCTAVALNSILA